MRKIIKILFIISTIIFAEQLPNKYWGSNNYSTITNRINTNHYFSMLSNSSNGMLSTYGVYGNSTQFVLNNRTQLYSNFNIIKSIQSEHIDMSDLRYSVNLGMKYQLSDYTSLSIGVTVMKSIIEGEHNHTYLP